MPIRVTLHQDPSIFDTLADDWTALLDHSPNDTLFLTPAYQRTWWQHLGRGALAVLTAHEGEALLGVAPLFVVEEDDRRVLHTVGCVEVSDYLDLVTASEREEDVLAAFLDFLAGPDAPAWDALDLCNVHERSPTLNLLPELAQARGWQTQIEAQEVCPVVALPDSWDAYLEALDGKDRRELRRKLRRAEAYDDDLNWRFVRPDEDLAQAAEDFLVLMGKSLPEKDAFLTPAMENFFRRLIQVTAGEGWLQLSFLEFRGHKLATYLNFLYKNRIFSYNSGLDWENDPRLGAGAVLTGCLIQNAIEEGREAYDFMRGNEQYKYRYGGEDVTVNRILVERGTA
jgi:CelD/BcsL family acetyltransferase involved in cellulose biosynthesis